MSIVVVALFVLSYFLAVIDGMLADKALYPSSSGRKGALPFTKEHPWIVAGGLCGIAATIIAAVE